jgi:hypothetical protein
MLATARAFLEGEYEEEAQLLATYLATLETKTRAAQKRN